jgi:Na+/H+-dicarboxylate symporter
VAILIGFGVAGIVSPGTGLSLTSDAAVKVKEAPGLMQVLVAMIPANPIDAMAKAQILPVIVFSLFVGIGIVHVGGERAQLLMKFFDAAAEVSYKIIGIVMQFAPIGVFALLLPVVAKNGPAVLLPLMSVIGCVAVGCVIHAIVVYSSLARIWGGHTPLEFFRGMSEAMMIAFTTCSSAAALPINMKNCQEKLGVSREVSSFVLPLGATINMDGTALYMGVCSLFIANVFGVDLTMGQMLMIILTGTLASIGTAGVPGAGLIMLAMVLQTAGLPLEGLALVAGIDRVLDMFRTCLNITGDGAVTIVMDQEEKKYDSGVAGAEA